MNKFEETVEELKSHVAELETEFSTRTENLNDETKAKALELVEKTKDVINTSIEKISAVIDNIKDEEKLNELLDKVKAKSKEAVEFTIDKIDDLTNTNDEFDYNSLHDDIMHGFDQLRENETFKKTTVLIKEGYAKINEFLDKPEVKETINKAKATTIKVAEKGVEGLKKVLDVKEEPKNDQE